MSSKQNKVTAHLKQQAARLDRPITKRMIAEATVIREAAWNAAMDSAYEAINALGGIGVPIGLSQEWGDGYCEAISDALRIIEKLGGRDPLKKDQP
jgi:hypothetical protein